MSDSSADRDRRSLLTGLSGFVLASLFGKSPASASLLLRSMPTADPGFVKTLLERYYAWHTKTHFDFQQALTEQDQQFIRYCFDHLKGFETRFPSGVALPTVLFSHRFSSGQRDSSRLAIGDFSPSEELNRLTEAACRKRGVNREKLGITKVPVGLGWEAKAGLFKVYAYFEKLSQCPDQELKELLKRVPQSDRHEMGLASYVFENGRIRERRLHVPLKIESLRKQAQDLKIPFATAASGGELIISDQRAPRMRLEVSMLNQDYLSEGEKSLVRSEMREFSIEPDSLIYQKPGENILYFP